MAGLLRAKSSLSAVNKTTRSDYTAHGIDRAIYAKLVSFKMNKHKLAWKPHLPTEVLDEGNVTRNDHVNIILNVSPCPLQFFKNKFLISW